LADSRSFWRFINNALQSLINTSGVQAPEPEWTSEPTTGGAMTSISIVSVREIAADDQSLKLITLFSCVGLVVSLCLMTAGIDLGAALI
jgi:hypothetical protein